MMISFGIFVSAGAAAAQTGVTTLAALKGQMRPLLVFAPGPDDPQLGIRLRTIEEHAAEAHDRKLVPIALPYASPSPTSVQLSTTDTDRQRRRFHVAPGDFAVVLIGTDGGEKLRSARPLSIAKLNATVDAMPMRQEEIRAK